jgi:hypothetical protein
MQPEIMDQLLTTVLSEYCSQPEKDMLHLEDLQLALTNDTAPLRLRNFKPIRDSTRAVTCWTSLSVIACLVLGLSRSSPTPVPGEVPEDASRKRQKTQTPLEDLMKAAIHGNGQSKLAAIQVLLFLFDQPIPLEAAVADELTRLLPDLVHEDARIQSWTYCVFAREVGSF